MRQDWLCSAMRVIGLMLVLALLVSCNTTPARRGSTTILLGSDFPTSGKEAAAGRALENAVRLAVDEANTHHAIPGYHLALMAKDDSGLDDLHDPARGQQNVLELAENALVAGIIGPLNSDVARAELPISNQAPIAQISPAASDPCLTQSGAAVNCVGGLDIVHLLRPTGRVTYFRLVTTDTYQGRVGADYLYRTQHYRTAYVVDDQQMYGVGLAQSFSEEWERLGGRVLGRASEAQPVSSYASILKQIAAQRPDVVYFAGLDVTGGLLLRQQMAQTPGLARSAFAGGDGLITPAFAAGVSALSGPVFATAGARDPLDAPAAADFRRRYLARYHSLGLYSALAYDSTQILIQAIRQAIAHGALTPADTNDHDGAKIFRQRVIDALRSIDYSGVSGHYHFDANGDISERFVSIYQLTPAPAGQPAWVYRGGVSV